MHIYHEQLNIKGLVAIPCMQINGIQCPYAPNTTLLCLNRFSSSLTSPNSRRLQFNWIILFLTGSLQQSFCKLRRAWNEAWENSAGSPGWEAMLKSASKGLCPPACWHHALMRDSCRGCAGRLKLAKESPPDGTGRGAWRKMLAGGGGAGPGGADWKKSGVTT